MEDTRTLADHHADLVCPHCATTTYFVRWDVLVGPEGPRLGLTMLELYCGVCKQRWLELRTGAKVQRFWTLAGTTTPDDDPEAA